MRLCAHILGVMAQHLSVARCKALKLLAAAAEDQMPQNAAHGH
jgi:hypothetical protein